MFSCVNWYDHRFLLRLSTNMVSDSGEFLLFYLFLLRWSFSVFSCYWTHLVRFLTLQTFSGYLVLKYPLGSLHSLCVCWKLLYLCGDFLFFTCAEHVCKVSGRHLYDQCIKILSSYFRHLSCPGAMTGLWQTSSRCMHRRIRLGSFRPCSP